MKAKFVRVTGGKERLRQFDVILTNPPFAGDISLEDTLSRYELAYLPAANGRRRRVNKISRDKLFIERCLAMLKPGGKMAIVLPRGVLKNYTDERVRRYFLKEARVVAVVGLGGSMFKPFTNTKTCVLFLEKRKKALTDLSKMKDPDVVYAMTERPGKDRSGSLIHDDKGNVVSDLPEITAYLKKKVKFVEGA